jgi:tetratricopeptide (TPR) repeat protein
MSDGLGYQANLQRGRLLRQSGRFEDACRFLGEAIQAEPEQPEPYLELALAQSEMPGKKADSVRSIERAVSLAPTSARMLGYQGYLLSHFGRHTEGLAVAKRALAMDPECYIALLAHANAYTKLGEWSRAETFARRILANFPADASALNLLAQSVRLQKRTEESGRLVAQILAHVPNDAFGHTNAGYEALNVDDHRRAETHFREALSRDPHFEHARRGLVQAFRMRSAFYRFNLKVLAFFDGDQSWKAYMKVLLVILTLMTFGMFLFVIAAYFAIVASLAPLGNLYLLVDPATRPFLGAKERSQAKWAALAGVLLLAGLAGDRAWAILVPVLSYLVTFAGFYAVPAWKRACTSPAIGPNSSTWPTS